MTFDIDELLDSSAPGLCEPAETHEAVVGLVVAARRAARPVRRRRRQAVLVGTTAALLTAGGTAVATTHSIWAAPWADHPLTSITYTLPSGGTCEQRIGNLKIADPAAQTLIQDWLGKHPITQIADVTAAIKEIRSEPNTWVENDGTSIRAGYGTAHYDADYEYDTAVWRALSIAVSAKLQSAGFTKYLSVTWAGETHCDGTRTDPEIPWYSR
ncbi:MAG: hypothetical protein ACRDPI_09370 [Nocardioidaceae bacterium]